MPGPVISRERWAALLAEVRFRTARSGGPGGQHVNKVETRVDLRFDVKGSAVLNDDEKHILLQRLASMVTADGELRVISRASRSQWQNRQRAVERLRWLLETALMPRAVRVATRPTAASRTRRLEAKRRRGQIKRSRRSAED